MSGVQLCRLLHADSVTAGVPVVLLTAAGDRRSRFWARSAGAVEYVSKTRRRTQLAEKLLPRVLKSSATAPPVSATVTSRGMVQERLSQLLDRALFDAVIAGEVRSLASLADAGRVFSDLAGLVSEVLGYRWLALVTADATQPLYVSTRTRSGRRLMRGSTARAALQPASRRSAPPRCSPTIARSRETAPRPS